MDCGQAAIFDLVLEDAPGLFMPIYQAVNFSSTPLIIFTLMGSVAMTLLSFILVIAGFFEKITYEMSTENLEAALRRRKEAENETERLEQRFQELESKVLKVQELESQLLKLESRIHALEGDSYAGKLAGPG